MYDITIYLLINRAYWKKEAYPLFPQGFFIDC